MTEMSAEDAGVCAMTSHKQITRGVSGSGPQPSEVYAEVEVSIDVDGVTLGAIVTICMRCLQYLPSICDQADAQEGADVQEQNEGHTSSLGPRID